MDLSCEVIHYYNNTITTAVYSNKTINWLVFKIYRCWTVCINFDLTVICLYHNNYNVIQICDDKFWVFIDPSLHVGS